MYPETLNTKEMISYVNNLSEQGVLGSSVLKDNLPEKTYYLKKIKVPKRVWDKKESEKLNNALHFRSNDILKKYAGLLTKFPPLVFGEEGVLIDGRHRLAAASYRGDSYVDVYLLDNIKEEELKIRSLRVKFKGSAAVFLSMKEALDFAEKHKGSEIILEDGGVLTF